MSSALEATPLTAPPPELQYPSCMQHSRLPLELCEQVIDCIWKTHPWWDRHQLVHRIPIYVGASEDPLRDLRACGWTCSAWYPRARFHIYHTVTFNHDHQVELFMRSVFETPHLADLVHELIVYMPQDTNIPFARGVLSTKLLRLRTVVFPLSSVHRVWLYPPHHHNLVTQFPLTDLVFDLSPYNNSMLVYALRIIWSLRDLRSLTMMLIGGAPVGQGNDSLVSRIRSLRRSWSCAKLKVLTLQGVFLQQTMAILPESPFGTTVEHLAVPFGDPSSWDPIPHTGFQAIIDQISLLSSLWELRIWAPSSGST
ncbi:hypothetical protein OH76DRAFT_476588 [Lentinus brumalis]|uniref:F-box domain-containing protein n=1 Tax=Lentinus brumalis TaxID=2498619 RepID=A0A371DBV9_9APHY|nr:hypothetical protein OH76DRAFT_476588 [Polyporus brumalis]